MNAHIIDLSNTVVQAVQVRNRTQENFDRAPETYRHDLESATYRLCDAAERLANAVLKEERSLSERSDMAHVARYQESEP